MIVGNGARVYGYPWIVGFVVLALLIIVRYEGPATAGSSVQAEADLLTYADLRHYTGIDAEEAMTVHLTAGDLRVRLVSILEWPRATIEMVLDAPQPYALHCELLDETGSVLWSGAVWQSSRKSRLHTPDGQIIEPASYAAGEMTLLDPRLTIIPVERLAPAASRLRVTLGAPAGGRAVVQAYRRDRVPPRDPVEAWYRLPVEEQERLATSNLYDPAAIDPGETARLMSHRWSRLPPAGIPGQHFRPVEIYRARREMLGDEPPLAAQLAADEALPLGRLQAYNAVGPGFLRLRLASPDPERPAVVTSDLHGLDGSRSKRLIAGPPPGEERTIPLWPGLNSLLIQAQGGPVEATVSQHRSAEDIGQALPPATSGANWYVLGAHPPHSDDPRGPPPTSIAWELPASGVDSEIYRVEIRPLLDPAGGAAEHQVLLQLRDRQDAVVRAAPVIVASEADPAAWLGGEATEVVGTSRRITVRPPLGSRSLTVLGTTPSLVRLLVRPHGLPFTPRSSLPDPALDEERGQPWHLVLSRDHAALLQSGHRILVHRADPWVGPEDRLPAEQRFTSSLVPVRGGDRRQLAWPVRPFVFDRDREWTTGHFSRLADADTQAPPLERGGRDLPHPLVLLPGDDGALPPTLPAAITGSAGHDRLLTAPLAADVDGRLLVNLPPRDFRSAPAWRTQAAMAAAPGETVTFLLDHKTGSATWMTVNAAAEASTAEGMADGGSFAFHLESLDAIDDRRWLDPLGAWSFRHRAYRLPTVSDQLPVDVRNPERRFAAQAAYALPLDSDLAPGRYLLHLHNTGHSRLWLHPTISRDQLLQDLHPFDQAAWNLRPGGRLQLRLRRSRHAHPLGDEPRPPRLLWCDAQGERGLPIALHRAGDGWWLAEVAPPATLGTLILEHQGPERSAAWQYLLQHVGSGNPQARRHRLYTAGGHRDQVQVLANAWLRESFLPLEGGLNYAVSAGEELRLTAVAITHPVIGLPTKRRSLELMWRDQGGQPLERHSADLAAHRIAADGHGGHWLLWRSQTITVPPGATRLHLPPPADDLRGLRCEVAWRRAPTIQVLPSASLRRDGILVRSPYNLPTWDLRFPLTGGEQASGRGLIVTRRIDRLFSPVDGPDWEELLHRSGDQLAIREHRGELHFREASPIRINDPRPWTPFTFALVPVNIPVPITVPSDPAADPTAAVPLRLHLELPADFPPGQTLLVQLNDDLVYRWQAVSAVGNIDLPLTPPGRHLLRIEHPLPGVQAFINAIPLGSGDDLRWRLRSAILVAADLPCTIAIPDDHRPRNRRVGLPLYLPATVANAGLLRFRVRLRNGHGHLLDDRIALWSGEAADGEAVTTSDGERWLPAGLITLDLPDDQDLHLELERPPGLPILLRPFLTYALPSEE